MIKAAHDDGEQVVQLSTVEAKFRSALTDTDPGVVMTAIQVMKTAMALKSSKGEFFYLLQSIFQNTQLQLLHCRPNS